MEINEEIVKEYFTTVQKCFILENVIYKVETHREGKKKGGGWSDIDLLAYQPSTNEVVDIEVKYREKAPFHRGADRASNLDKVINNFKLISKSDRIREYNPNNLPIRKVFVTNKKAFTEKTRKEYEQLLNDESIRLLYFEELFAKLQEHFRNNPNKMTSVIGQVLRVINNQSSDNDKDK